eukprot:13784943-Ditylum_brightwellii.AAC.1
MAKELTFQQVNVMQNVSSALENQANAAVTERKTTEELIVANKTLTDNNALLAEQLKKFQDNYSQLNNLVKELHGNQMTNHTW